MRSTKSKCRHGRLNPEVSLLDLQASTTSRIYGSAGVHSSRLYSGRQLGFRLRIGWIYFRLWVGFGWHSTPVLLPGKSHEWRSLVGCSPRGREESDTTERLHFHFSLWCIGEGNGNPLQCSCLENPKDGGAWWAAVYGVAQSRTRLKQLSRSSSSGMGVFRDKANSDSMLETVSLTCFLLWKC